MNKNIGIKDVNIRDYEQLDGVIVMIQTTSVPWVEDWEDGERMILSIVPDIGRADNYSSLSRMPDQHTIQEIVTRDQVEEFLRGFKDGVDRLNRERPVPERIVKDTVPAVTREVFGDLMVGE